MVTEDPVEDTRQGIKLVTDGHVFNKNIRVVQVTLAGVIAAEI